MATEENKKPILEIKWSYGEKKVFFSRNPGKNILVMQRFWKIKKRKERSFINWNEHRETTNVRIGTKTVLRVKNKNFPPKLKDFGLRTQAIGSLRHFRGSS